MKSEIGLEYFFAVVAECHFCPQQKLSKEGKNFLLPQLGKIFGKEIFAEMYMGWNQKGLAFRFRVSQESEVTSSYPDIQQADSIELFIDTRDVKSARSTHRFCHHFFFLPVAVEGISCGEITRFRTEDSHPLCKSEDLDLLVVLTKEGYVADIFIPRECLVGFDPEENGRIGFTYRINQGHNRRQLFGMAEEVEAIDRHPYLWSTLYLKP